ncbi:uncharacterized protein JCM10292_007726 [Rhodotorula paludigena]|uniref:uncharacterized protein n=1 Tax=Rhodotorula paludigena TaxID=86838 RepID=UPI003179C989
MATAAWTHAYPFSLQLDPARSIESYFPRLAQSDKGRLADPASQATTDPRKRRRLSKDAGTASAAAAAVPTPDSSLSCPARAASTVQSVPTSATNEQQRSASIAVKRPGPILASHPPAVPPASAPNSAANASAVPRPSPSALPAHDGKDDDDEYRLPSVLSRNALHPPLAGLKFDYYRPYLLARPISPAWSSLYCETFIHFCCSVSDPHTWSTRPQRLLAVDNPPDIVQHLRSLEPNRAVFRARAPLHKSDAHRSVGDADGMAGRLLAMKDVMRWIWDDDSIGLDEVAGMILTAPLAVHMIIRTLASTQRYTIVRRIAEEDLFRYLRHRSPSLYTPRERAALTLLEWLVDPRAPDLVRRYRFLLDREGRVRRGARSGESPWEWWLQAGEGEARTAEVLDDWEREVIRTEGWDAA